MSIRDIVEYEVEPVADDEEYSLSHQTNKGKTESPCLVIVAENQREDPSHSLEYCRVCCCHHSRTVFKVDKCELSHIPSMLQTK